MISRIHGRLLERRTHSVIIDVHGLSYEVWVPVGLLSSLDQTIDADGYITLVTYHYHQVEPSRSTPVLVGFPNEVEREFFERFITVSGVGPKAAVKALSLPVATIARGIDSGDARLLQSLPGIGAQRAREIIAKLQGKVGKYGLIQNDDVSAEPALKDVGEEALAVLCQLQYAASEAKRMVQAAQETMPGASSAEELLNEVYRQRATVGAF